MTECVVLAENYIINRVLTFKINNYLIIVQCIRKKYILFCHLLYISILFRHYTIACNTNVFHGNISYTP